jgi:quaternary ammonium compound-resistance protein SugE
MAWVVLLLAGLVEIVMAISLKFADGWTRFWPSVIGVTAGLVSIVLLTVATRQLPVSTAYAVWTGTGAVGVTVIGMVALGDSAHPLRLVCIGIVFLGIVGLHLLDGRV